MPDSTDFQERFLPSPEDRELASLEERFDNLIEEPGLGNRYAPINYDDLEDDQKELIDSMNLAELFRDHIAEEETIDIALVRFVLRRLAQLGDESVLDDVLDNLDKLYLSFLISLSTFVGLAPLPKVNERLLAKRVIKLLENSIVSELDYHRLWGFYLFAESTAWDNEAKLPTLLAQFTDLMSRRKLILAMARARQQYWFQSQWRNLFNESAWPRRAMIAGFSCLPPDLRKHLYRSIEPQLNPLRLR